MTRCLHIFSKLDRGGAELRTLEFIKRNSGLAKFDILLLSGEAGALDEEFKKFGILYYKRLSLRNVFWCFLHLRQENYRIVHSHVLFSSALFMFLAYIAGVPKRIAHIRSSNVFQGNWLKVAKDHLLRKALIVFSTHIICITRTVAIKCFGINWIEYRSLIVLHNAYEFIPQPKCLTQEGHFCISHIGRFNIAKNQDFVASIFKQILTEKGRFARLYFVGRLDKDIYPRVVSKFIHSQFAANVTFTNEISNVGEYIIKSDLIIFPSRWEGLGGVIIEAISHGKPVLTSNLEVFQELAAELKGIHCLNIEEPVSKWVEKIYELIGLFKNNTSLSIELQESFLNSSFTIEQHDKTLKDLYK